MPYYDLADGLYLLVQKSIEKGVDHYGILDIGNRLQLKEAMEAYHPVVIHQTPPSIQIKTIKNSSTGKPPVCTEAKERQGTCSTD